MIKEKLGEGVVRPLISQDDKLVKKVLPKIVKDGWTARKVERYLAEHKKKSSATAVKRSAHIKEEDKLSAKYNAVVRISGRTLTFRCKNELNLKALIKQLGDQ